MKTAYDIIIKPVITEQSMEATEDKKYVFKVATDANKTEIKKAIEKIFDVNVYGVRQRRYWRSKPDKVILRIAGKRAASRGFSASVLPSDER